LGRDAAPSCSTLRSRSPAPASFQKSYRASGGPGFKVTGPSGFLIKSMFFVPPRWSRHVLFFPPVRTCPHSISGCPWVCPGAAETREYSRVPAETLPDPSNSEHPDVTTTPGGIPLVSSTVGAIPGRPSPKATQLTRHGLFSPRRRLATCQSSGASGPEP
jgi:hypothetical protein